MGSSIRVPEDETRKKLEHLRIWLSDCNQNADRNVESKGHADDMSDGKEDGIGNRTKGHLWCDKELDGTMIWSFLEVQC